MESDLISFIISILFLILLACTHIGITLSNRIILESQNNRKTVAQRVLHWFVKTENEVSASLYLYKILSLVVFLQSYLSLVNRTGVRIFYLQDLDVWMHLIIMIVSYFILVELIPRMILSSHAQKTLEILTLPYLLVHLILYPFIKISQLFNKKTAQSLVFKIFPRQYKSTDIEEMILSDEELSNEIQIYQNSIEFGKVKARDCMIPRTDIIGVDVTSDIDSLREKFVETGVSKLVIYKENLDNIIGYVHSFDLFSKPKTITQILRPISFVPSAIFAQEILEMFTQKSLNIAIVVDEYGGTDGLITIEDIVEEIFGEIEDEYDVENSVEQKISASEYVFSARLEIDYLNETYDFDLPESEDYDTLGGLIINILEEIPEVNQEVVLAPYVFIVEKVSERKIESVRMKISH